jgi:hypothetical protein
VDAVVETNHRWVVGDAEASGDAVGLVDVHGDKPCPGGHRLHLGNALALFNGTRVVQVHHAGAAVPDDLFGEGVFLG